MTIHWYNNLNIKKQEALTAWIFIIPFLIGFLVFHGLPFIFSFIISFTNLRYISNLDAVRFVGFKNFINMFQDDRVIDSLYKSFKYSIIFVPLVMGASLLFALAINEKLIAKNAIRTMIFMPYVSNLVAVSIVWLLLLQPDEGPVNMFLRSLGIENPPLWFFGQNSVIPTIVIVHAWQSMGLQFVTFLAALQGVPKELMEAAQIDGAKVHHRFFYITVPMISPTTFFLLIITIIGSLKNFSIIQVLTKGGPGNASKVLSMNIVQEAFQQFRLGYASTQGLLLFAIIMVITIIQWRGQKRWVNYV